MQNDNKHKKLTDSELRQYLEESIETMRGIVTNETAEDGKRTNAANALSGLITRYKELYPVASEEPSKMRAVKNF